MAAIDDLTSQVTANTTVEGSALVLINGFKDQLAAAVTAAAAGNDAPMAALQASLAASANDLAAAVAANTPAAPARHR